MIIIIIIIIANNIYRKQTQKAANVQRGQSINNVLHVFQNIQWHVQSVQFSWSIDPYNLAIEKGSLLITGRNTSITITHGAILRFFAPQGRYIPPIVAKFSTAEESNNPLHHAKFQVDRSIYGDFWPQNFKNPKFCKLIRHFSIVLCAYGFYENVSNLVSFGA